MGVSLKTLKLLQAAGVHGEALKEIVASMTYDLGEVPHVSLLRTTKKTRRMDMPVVNATRLRIFARDDYICQYCLKKCDSSDGNLMPSADHIIARSRGGSNGQENLVTSCYGCNRSKGSMSIAEWKGADHPLVARFPGKLKELSGEPFGSPHIPRRAIKRLKPRKRSAVPKPTEKAVKAAWAEAERVQNRDRDILAAARRKEQNRLGAGKGAEEKSADVADASSP
jgi:hypothetical protein